MSPAPLSTVAAEIASAEAKKVGPHPSLIRVAKPFLFQRDIESCLQSIGSSPIKEDTFRLQGVAWIENVRRALQLPVRTSNTAVIYYHKFRLVHSDTDYSYLDAAASALFTACKIEDTLKKSREILCCAHNLKLTTSTSVHHPDALSPDDQLFLGPSLTVIGLERLMLESSGFDFRNRQPQRPLIKVCRLLGVPRDTVGKTAWAMCKDLYRTFAPLKQGSGTMAWACTELALRMYHGADEGSSQIEGWLAEMKRGTEYRKWNTTRAEVMETLLDLLDLYTHSRGSTIVGGKWSLDAFIAVRIVLNQEVEAEGFARYTESKDRAPATLNGLAAEDQPFDKANPEEKLPLTTLPSPVEASASRTKSTSGERPRAGPPTGTVRFMLDPERARGEKHIVQGYWKVETEEYEEIIEREVPRDEEPRRTREAGDPRRTRERERDRERDRDRDRDRDPGRDRERDRGGRRRDRDRGEAGGRRERDRGVRRR